jgi:hypothetical protein
MRSTRINLTEIFCVIYASSLELKFKAKKLKSTQSGLNQPPVVFETT